MLTSKELELIQETLKRSIKASLNRPDCDYDKVKELVEVTGRVDTLRRRTWHNEKFGYYEELAQSTIDSLEEDDKEIDNEESRRFASDDIPF